MLTQHSVGQQSSPSVGHAVVEHAEHAVQRISLGDEHAISERKAYRADGKTVRQPGLVVGERQCAGR